MIIKKRNTLHQSSVLGISIKFETIPGGYNPLHYHDELEILFPLNGDMDIWVDGERQKLQKKNLTVIECGQIHHTYAKEKYSMLVCIHISKKHLQSYFPEIELSRISCNPEKLSTENADHYIKLCLLLSELVKLYMTEELVFEMEADGILLQVMALLIRYFATFMTPQATTISASNIERIRSVISYVQNHYQEAITLEDMSNLLGIDKSYFCRFFKRNMGISFLNYLNEVRLSHVYQDLMETDLPVTEIKEKHGFHNQKLFNSAFKKLYGCTPTEVRKSLNEREEIFII